MSRPAWLWLLLAGSFLITLIWVFSTPPPIAGVGEAWRSWGNFHPDEYSHIAVVRYMAVHPGTLPPYQMLYDTSVHPPLYHGLAAIVDRLLVPVLGEVGAVYVLRLLSAVIGSATLFFVYRAVRQTRLGRAVALPATLLAALVPMRLSLSGAVTNENLAALGATAALAYFYEAMRFGFTTRRFLLLTLWTVIAVGCKVTCYGLLLTIALGLWLTVCQRRVHFPQAIGLMALLVVAVVGAWGWWFVYNTVHFGDPLRKAAVDRMWDGSQPGYSVIGPLYHFAPWRYLLSIIGNGWLSFWGRFDGMRHSFPIPVYVLIGVVQLMAFAGLGMRLRRLIVRSPIEAAQWGATGLFVAWVLLVYCEYNWAHYTPQGRYFFVLLAPFGALMAGGFNIFLRAVIRDVMVRRVIWVGLGALLVLLNLYAAYEMPRHRPTALAITATEPIEYRYVVNR